MIFMTKNLSLGERLKILRAKTGLSQAKLAGKLEISPSTIGMYEQNRREPSKNMLLRLCEFFNVSMDYLTGYKFTSKNSEIECIISDFLNFFENKNNLTRNGKPIGDAEKKKIANDLRKCIKE